MDSVQNPLVDVILGYVKQGTMTEKSAAPLIRKYGGDPDILFPIAVEPAVPHVNGHSTVADVVTVGTAPPQPTVSPNDQPGIDITPEPVFLDGEDMLGYIRLLFEPGDWINLQFIHQTEKWTDDNGRLHAKIDNNYMTVEEALKESTVASIADAQSKGWNSYIAMNAFTPGVTRRRKKDVKTIRTVYVEFDEKSEIGLDCIDTDDRLKIIPEPHFMLESSPGKFYVIWRVKDFTVEQQEGLNSGLH